MTEKRFVKTHKTINWWAVLDNGKELLEDEVVELLNELHEENQRLNSILESVAYEVLDIQKKKLNEELLELLDDFNSITDLKKALKEGLKGL